MKMKIVIVESLVDLKYFVWWLEPRLWHTSDGRKNGQEEKNGGKEKKERKCVCVWRLWLSFFLAVEDNSIEKL